jgi:glycosyltransferase involved in cell wall biosynthesis
MVISFNYNKCTLPYYYNYLTTEHIVIQSGEVFINSTLLRKYDKYTIYPGQAYRIKVPHRVRFTSTLDFPISALIRRPLPTFESSCKHPFLSFVIIGRNVAPFVGQALISLTTQTTPDVDIIFVDDASSDETRDIVRTYALLDKRVTLIPLNARHGPNRARAEGLYHAKGQYVVILDGDDWLVADAAAHLKRTIKAHSCDLAFFGYTHYNHRTRHFGAQILPYPKGESSRLLFSLAESQFIWEASRINHTFWACCFSSAKIPHLRSSLIDAPLYEDLPFFITAIKSSTRAVVINASLYFYRVGRPGQATSKWGETPPGKKIACLETALHAVEKTLSAQDRLSAGVLLGKLIRIVHHEIKLLMAQGDTRGAEWWLRVYFTNYYRLTPIPLQLMIGPRVRFYCLLPRIRKFLPTSMLCAIIKKFVK